MLKAVTFIWLAGLMFWGAIFGVNWLCLMLFTHSVAFTAGCWFNRRDTT